MINRKCIFMSSLIYICLFLVLEIEIHMLPYFFKGHIFPYFESLPSLQQCVFSSSACHHHKERLSSCITKTILQLSLICSLFYFRLSNLSLSIFSWQNMLIDLSSLFSSCSVGPNCGMNWRLGCNGAQ